MRRLWWTIPAFALLVGCADDAGEGVPETCPAGEQYNPLRGECVPERGVGGGGPGPASDASSPAPSSPDTSGPDASSPDPFAPDASGPDAGSTDSGDDAGGHEPQSDAGAGETCDDGSPAGPEICDERDNDCNGLVNDGIDCVFYAHSTALLYEIDPFAKTATEVGTARVSALAALFDIDTGPDGTLYGIAGDRLYSYDPASGEWTGFDDPLGTNVGTANGMAIDGNGAVYLTASNKLYTADLTTGHGSLVGQTGSFSSSGDTVVTKGDVLYMTASPGSYLNRSDRLVKIDGNSAQTTAVGDIGFGNVWGLTAGWNQLYGLTEGGELIRIDTLTGQGTLVHRFSGISFYGAASTPAR